MADELQLFVKWSEFLKWLLDRTERFPKRLRFTITCRIENLALDILETIIQLRYQPKKRMEHYPLLNISFEKLRVLLRLCHEQHCLSTKQFHYALSGIDEAGKMCAAWLKRENRERK